MRVIFIADVHHAFAQVERLLESTEADLYLITGDLVSRAFFRYATAWRFMELQQAMAGYRTRENLDETLDLAALRILKSGKQHPQYSQAEEYLALSSKAETYLKKSYGRLAQIIASFPRKKVYVLPGNYDMNLSRTALGLRDIHLKCVESDGLRVAGLGGADVMTPGMPDHLQVSYGRGENDATFLGFLKEARPHMLVLHQPPYGFHDVIPGHGHSGSHFVRDFVDESNVSVVFSGHHHEQWGAIYSKGIWSFNPSNFGRTLEVSGARPGGFFFDIAIENKRVEAATLRRLEKKGVFDIIDYYGDKKLEKVILDEERYMLLGGKARKTTHIEPIRQFQRIKTFFLNYETPESISLVHELRSIYRKIHEQGMEVAFDLLGSISFGIAQESSDMDVVVYMRSRDCVIDDEDTCGVPRPLATVFDELKERHLEVEVCDSLDLDRITLAIEEEDSEDGQLQRFIFYRLVCRPVNLRAVKRVENLLFEKDRFRREVEEGLEEYISVLVSSVRHVKSFEKYKARLRERNIDIPPDVEEAIRNYLRA